VAKNLGSAILARYQEHPGLDFLTSRDADIWLPLFILCGVLCPERMTELERTATDLSTEKTGQSKRYVNLLKGETAVQEDEYARKLLVDCYSVAKANGKVVSTTKLVDALLAIPTAPWRKFRGEGLNFMAVSAMLSRFGVRPVRIRIGPRRLDVTGRGYRLADLETACTKNKLI
jgi:hypothetical protein